MVSDERPSAVLVSRDDYAVFGFEKLKRRRLGLGGRDTPRALSRWVSAAHAARKARRWRHRRPLPRAAPFRLPADDSLGLVSIEPQNELHRPFPVVEGARAAGVTITVAV
jgi:hypothetical protein